MVRRSGEGATRGAAGSGARHVLAALALLPAAMGGPALADDPGGDRDGSPGPEVDEGRRPAPPRAVARFEGLASPGLRITLKAEGDAGPDATFRWVQVGGPPVALGSPDRPETTLVVPDREGTLDFLLVVGDAGGIDTARLSVPVEPSKATRAPAELVADAGDDQIGLVGQQITLNGIRSRPRGRIGYRWLQVEGPPAPLALQDEYVFTFIPPAPGIYRFALLVAEGGRISEPSFVRVTVGPPPSGPGEASPLAASSSPGPTTLPADVSFEELARVALLAVPGGTSAAEGLAGAFEAVARKMDLYESYAFVFQELTRRLEEFLPDDPSGRALWSERVFMPLTFRLVAALRVRGLDLSHPAGQSAPLSAGQREALSEHFLEMARGFRKAAQVR